MKTELFSQLFAVTGGSRSPPAPHSPQRETELQTLLKSVVDTQMAAAGISSPSGREDEVLPVGVYAKLEPHGVERLRARPTTSAASSSCAVCGQAHVWCTCAVAAAAAARTQPLPRHPKPPQRAADARDAAAPVRSMEQVWSVATDEPSSLPPPVPVEAMPMRRAIPSGVDSKRRGGRGTKRSALSPLTNVDARLLTYQWRTGKPKSKSTSSTCKSDGSSSSCRSSASSSKPDKRWRATARKAAATLVMLEEHREHAERKAMAVMPGDGTPA